MTAAEVQLEEICRHIDVAVHYVAARDGNMRVVLRDETEEPRFVIDLRGVRASYFRPGGAEAVEIVRGQPGSLARWIDTPERYQQVEVRSRSGDSLRLVAVAESIVYGTFDGQSPDDAGFLR